MDKEYRKLEQEIKERIGDDGKLLAGEYWCRPDGARKKFVMVEVFGPERAAIKFAHDSKLLDKSIIHVKGHGRYMVIYRIKGDEAIKQQMGAHDKMIPIVEVFK